MGNITDTELTEEEFEIAVERFLNTYKDFRKVAKKLMAFMEDMNRKMYQELKEISGDNQQIHEFLIQIMDDSGQIGERCFGIKCVAEKEKKQE